MSAPALQLLRRAWAPEILLVLDGESRRFNRIMAAIPGISDRLLTERLRDLELMGFVRRDVEAGPPIRVYYTLTSEAEALLEPLRLLAAV